MEEVILSYQRRGWKLFVNSRRQVIFRQPNSTGWFALNNCSEREANYIRGL